VVPYCDRSHDVPLFWNLLPRFYAAGDPDSLIENR